MCRICAKRFDLTRDHNARECRNESILIFRGSRSVMLHPCMLMYADATQWKGLRRFVKQPTSVNSGVLPACIASYGYYHSPKYKAFNLIVVQQHKQ